ncbi:hypothetical protein VP01_105g4 [Puccinia sorghi]|uniref:Uncharacterized protein n=1 Tax=Puccinia sorghi TaxID=27349 RepID=A0A0L6VVA3_9BASI|nr:hypothetical protein VP01_105g4 [Puccinia sorghi]
MNKSTIIKSTGFQSKSFVVRKWGLQVKLLKCRLFHHKIFWGVKSSMVKFIFPPKKNLVLHQAFCILKPNGLIYFRFNLIKSCEKELWKKSKNKKNNTPKKGISIPFNLRLTHCILNYCNCGKRNNLTKIHCFAIRKKKHSESQMCAKNIKMIFFFYYHQICFNLTPKQINEGMICILKILPQCCVGCDKPGIHEELNQQTTCWAWCIHHTCMSMLDREAADHSVSSVAEITLCHHLYMYQYDQKEVNTTLLKTKYFTGVITIEGYALDWKHKWKKAAGKHLISLTLPEVVLKEAEKYHSLLLYSRDPLMDLMEFPGVFHHSHIKWCQNGVILYHDGVILHQNDVILHHGSSFGVLQFILCPHDLRLNCLVNYNSLFFLD